MLWITEIFIVDIRAENAQILCHKLISLDKNKYSWHQAFVFFIRFSVGITNVLEIITIFDTETVSVPIHGVHPIMNNTVQQWCRDQSIHIQKIHQSPPDCLVYMVKIADSFEKHRSSHKHNLNTIFNKIQVPRSKLGQNDPWIRIKQKSRSIYTSRIYHENPDHTLLSASCTRHPSNPFFQIFTKTFDSFGNSLKIRFNILKIFSNAPQFQKIHPRVHCNSSF
jgi:hypothetical protein